MKFTRFLDKPIIQLSQIYLFNSKKNTGILQRKMDWNEQRDQNRDTENRDTSGKKNLINNGCVNILNR